MSLLSAFRLLKLGECTIIPAQYAIQTRNYAAIQPRKMKKQIKIEKKKLPVESDAEKLLTYVCGSNIYKEGEDIKLKPDSEYPDWLWNLRTEPKKLSEMDPNTKEYWRLVRKLALYRNNKMMKYRKL